MSEYVFPVTGAHTGTDICKFHVKGGLTKRELFAAMAMSNLMDRLNLWDNEQRVYDSAAKVSIKMADALIAELEKEQDEN